MSTIFGVSLPLVGPAISGCSRGVSPALAKSSEGADDRRTLPGFEAVAWYAITAPPKTPKNITDKIHADVNEALRQPELQDRLKKLSAETLGGSVEKTAGTCRKS